MKRKYLILLCSIVFFVSMTYLKSDLSSDKQKTTVVSEFLKANKLQGKIVLIEIGMIGCDLSDNGLDTMIEFCSKRRITDLNYVRLEALNKSEESESYYKAKKVLFPVFYDLEMSVAKALEAAVFPRFVLLDKYGRIRYRGSLPEEKDLKKWTSVLKSEKNNQNSNVELFNEKTLNAKKLLNNAKLPDLNGKVKALAEYKSSSGITIIFVDTKCPFSLNAIEQLNEISVTLNKFKVPFILINIGESKKTVLDFYKDKNPGVGVLYDTSNKTQQDWNIEFVPTVILISNKSEVSYKGPADWTNLAKSAEKMLGLKTGSIKFISKGTESG